MCCHSFKHYLLSGMIGLLVFNGAMAVAEDGVYLQGNGVKSAGMGGASVALSHDAMAGANNPASMAYVGNRFTIGSQFFNAHADERNLYGIPGNNVESTQVWAAIPELGVNYRLNRRTAVGLSMYGAGVTASFKQPLLPASVAPGLSNAKLGLGVVQSVVSVSYLVAPNFAVGIGPVIGLTKYSVTGAPIANSTGWINHGNAYALGYGLSAGALWSPAHWASLGFSYTTKVNYTKLGEYKEDLLKSSNGRSNMPEVYKVGVGVRPTRRLLVAVDYNRINWSKVGYGKPDQFGWEDQNVEKFGAAYDVSGNWTVRAGYSYSPRQFSASKVSNNVFAPVLHQQAATFGATRKTGKRGELSFFGDYDFGGGRAKGTDGTQISSKYGFYGIEYQLHFE